MSTQKSFTLLELLIVIAIIAILAATVIVSLSGARQSANEARGLQFSQNIKSTLATDLVGEWSFDNQSNPGRDDSGNNNNGTVYGATWTPNGKVRGALSFDGINDYVDCGNSNIFRISDLITLEAWVYPLSFKNYSIIIYKWDSSYGIRLISSGQLQFILNGGERALSQTPLILNKWNHVVATYDSKNAILYVNGDVVSSRSYSTTINLDDYPIRISWYNTNAFHGLIDEVRIYNRALTAYEIKALYAEGKMRHLADK